MTVDPTTVETPVVVSQEVEAEAEAEKVVVVAEGTMTEVVEAVVDGKVVEKTSSYREESNFLSDLKEFERKALNELKGKLEEAILGGTLFGKVTEGEKKKRRKDGWEKVEEAKEEDGAEKEKLDKGDDDEKEGKKVDEEEEKIHGSAGNGKCVEVDREISIWGVPLLPDKGHEGTDVVLLKFLRAREFKVNDAFEMLRGTLCWRKESSVESVLEEEGLGLELCSAGYLNGIDREGHPVCYNIYGAFGDEQLYKAAFGTAEKRERFLRWRVQLMEQGIQKLDLTPGGVSSLLQINDLKNAPGPSKKDIRIAMKQAIELLQDNYPEFVARNIVINVPFWYYAFNTIISPFLTQRSKSKFVLARPAKVTETLLKYIPVEEIPVQYGGLKRENDFEFSAEDGMVSELTIKSGSTEVIEMPVEEVGKTLLWDITVLGWEVNYKEEFVPSDEGSYTVMVQKSKKLSASQEPIRNTFRNNEPGKVVITIENGSNKKRRVFYRYKTKKCSSF